MPAPNDDAAAFGWDLSKLRYPADSDDPKDVWPGKGVFDIPLNTEARQVYGHNMRFICPIFVQAMLDAEPAVKKYAEKAKAAGYSAEAMARLDKVIKDVFKTKILPEIISRFQDVSPMIAEFYAARLAHIAKFGNDD